MPDSKRMAGIRITPARRLAFFITVDVALVLASLFLALWLRFEFQAPPAAFLRTALVMAALAAAATVVTLYETGIYRIAWSHVGLRDIGRVALGVVVTTLVMGAVAQMTHVVPDLRAFPRSVVLLQAPITFCALAGFRLAKRASLRIRGQRRVDAGQPTLLVGAGDAGAQVLRSILATNAPYHVVGFLDDDPLARRTLIEGVEVLGPLSDLEKQVELHKVEVVILCVANATSKLVQDVVHRAQDAGVGAIRIVPPVSQLVGGEVSIATTRKVELQDLLGREAIRIDNDEVSHLLARKRVVVTGGAGTIGSELCRQIARFSPKFLTIVDVDESRLHDLAVDLAQAHPGLDVHQALVDVRDAREVGDLFARERPEVVFHAAAYKHVPMMELYPLAALEANVIGTANVIAAAESAGCERFVLISTDKAVDPSSIMGASKRLAELVAFTTPPRAGKPMIRSAVRFGNVIGSRGSVIPIFERQLKNGGPLTVTHPDMERFFMMTSEAVSLVLQSAALGQGNDMFVLDMGKPVRILDVAREFIRLHGLREGEDIRIVFTGLRPGEKLREVLNYESEPLAPTKHPRVMRAAVRPEAPADLLSRVEALVRAREPEKGRAFFDEQFPSLRAFAASAGAKA